MKYVLPTLGLILAVLTGCDETTVMSTGSSAALKTSSSAGLSAIDRARPAAIDQSKYSMIVPVNGSNFSHDLFKSPIHAQEAGYCLSMGYGPVTKVIQGQDPRTRESFYFIECEKTDPSTQGLDDRIAALEAQQGAYDARTAEMQAAADAAVANAGDYVDPYANCPIGQGGFPIVRDDCVSTY